MARNFNRQSSHRAVYGYNGRTEKEYRIRFALPAREAFDRLIRGSQFFGSFDAAHRLYNLWLSVTEEAGRMPDVCLAIEGDGIYFCDNSSADVSEIVRILMQEAKKHSDVVCIEEL